jgi:excisionase family DNA binding protein
MKEADTMGFATIKDISKYLKVKESTLYSWVHNGLIPSYKLNGLLRFDMDEIEVWVKASKQMPCNADIKLKRPANQDIEKILKKAIDSVKGKGYNPYNGKPGQIKVSERRDYGTL